MLFAMRIHLWLLIAVAVFVVWFLFFRKPKAA